MSFQDHRLGEYVVQHLRGLPELRGVHLWLVNPHDVEGELRTRAAEASMIAVRVEGPDFFTDDFTGERLLVVTIRIREHLWHRPLRNARGELANTLAARLRGFMPPGAVNALRPHLYSPRSVPEVPPHAGYREEVLRYTLSAGYAADE